MPMPMEIRRASEDFEIFLDVVLDASGLATRNQVYTMTDGVLRAFRRRLDLHEAIRFAGALPPVLRAIFVADWNLDEPRRPFDDRTTMTREVQALRVNHNCSPDTAIRDVALGVRRIADRDAFDRVIAALPEGAVEFWRI